MEWLSALIGAVVGGAFTLVGSMIAQRKAAVDQTQQWRRDRLTDALLHMVILCDQVSRGAASVTLEITSAATALEYWDTDLGAKAQYVIAAMKERNDKEDVYRGIVLGADHPDAKDEYETAQGHLEEVIESFERSARAHSSELDVVG